MPVADTISCDPVAKTPDRKIGGKNSHEGFVSVWLTVLLRSTRHYYSRPMQEVLSDLQLLEYMEFGVAEKQQVKLATVRCDNPKLVVRVRMGREIVVD